MADRKSTVSIQIAVQSVSGPPTDITVEVRHVYNFGYAARDSTGAQKHVDDMRALGMPAPSRLPAIFPVPADRVRTAGELTVSGDDTYGEVEFALVNTDHGWLVTIASDHTDLEVETVNMAKAKASSPDVVGDTAWRLDEVGEQWDDCVLRLWGQNPDGTEELVQSGKVGHLLPPADMQRILAERSATTLGPGTVILSGTLDGEPTPGKVAWRAELEDPHSGRKLELAYSLNRLALEL